jgi:hypothetical protein
VESVLPIIVGGVLSLVSTVVGALVHHYIWVRGLKYSRQANMAAGFHRSQMAFFKQLPAELDKINGYATTAEVLFEQGEAEKAAAYLKEHLADFSGLHRLLAKYKLILPSQLIDRGGALVTQCHALAWQPSQEAANDCVASLFKYEDLVREYIGVEPLHEKPVATLQADAVGQTRTLGKGVTAAKQGRG